MPQPSSPRFSSLDDVVTIPAPSSADPGGSSSESCREEEVRAFISAILTNLSYPNSDPDPESQAGTPKDA